LRHEGSINDGRWMLVVLIAESTPFYLHPGIVSAACTAVVTK
jgi:hypothetical protein